MHLNIVGVMMAGLSAWSVHAAEPVPEGPPRPGSELVTPDRSKPVWVIIQCDKAPPPKMTEEHKKKLGGLLSGPFFGLPTGVGFALEQGRVTRPWLSCIVAGAAPEGRMFAGRHDGPSRIQPSNAREGRKEVTR